MTQHQEPAQQSPNPAIPTLLQQTWLCATSTEQPLHILSLAISSVINEVSGLWNKE